MSMLYDANQRIEKIRKKDVEFIVRKDGRPVSNAQINVKMKKHQSYLAATVFQRIPMRRRPALVIRSIFLICSITLPFRFFWQRYEKRTRQN